MAQEEQLTRGDEERREPEREAPDAERKTEKAAPRTEEAARKAAEKERKTAEKEQKAAEKAREKAERKAGKAREETERKTEKAEEKARKEAEKEERKAGKAARKAAEREQKAVEKAVKEAARPPRPLQEPPKRSVLEEVGNAVTHGVGALFSIAGTVLLILKSDTDIKLLASIVYGICLILLFLMSCLYHSFRWGSAVKRLWRRFDYLSIYLLIGGTFTPIWLVHWGNEAGFILCGVQWAIILTGIVFVAVFGPTRMKKVHTAAYIILGWSALVFLPGMLRNNLPLFLTVLGGGVVYTVGIIPFALKRKGAHFIWHFFVLAGAVLQWLGIYLYLY